MSSRKLMAAIQTNDPLAVARALRSPFTAPLSEQDATALSAWVKRNASRRKASGSRRPRKDDPYKDQPGNKTEQYIGLDGEVAFVSPRYDELSRALVRGYPEEIVRQIVAGLPRPWLVDLGRWIERCFGPAPRGRPKRAPIDKTIEMAFLVASARDCTVKRASERLGKRSNDPKWLAVGEREPYEKNSQRLIARARKFLRASDTTPPKRPPKRRTALRVWK